MEPNEWKQGFEREAETLLAAVALSDNFWADVEPKIAVKFAWNQFASAILKFPALRRELAKYAVDASCWNGIKRRWFPMWAQRKWPPLVDVYDITEVSSPNKQIPRYLLVVTRMTQAEWVVEHDKEVER